MFDHINFVSPSKDVSSRSRVFDATAFKHLYGAQPGKIGAWASEDFHLNFWYLEPDQKMVPLRSKLSTIVYVVLQGSGALHIIDDSDPAIQGMYCPNAQAVVPPPTTIVIPRGADQERHKLSEKATVTVLPMTLHYVKNDAGSRMVLAAFSSRESLSDDYLAR